MGPGCVGWEWVRREEFGGQEAEKKSTVALGSCSADGTGRLITSPFRLAPSWGCWVWGSGVGGRWEVGGGRAAGPRDALFMRRPHRIGYYPEPL